LGYLYGKGFGSSQTLSRTNTPIFLKPSHSLHLPVYEDGTECSETSAYKIQTPGNYPEESIQHLEHGGSLKSRVCVQHVMNDVALQIENE